MSKISNAVVAASSATATGSGGGGICSVNGDWLMGDFPIATIRSLIVEMVLVGCGPRQRPQARGDTRVSSLPGLTRQSVRRFSMDHRVKPGGDEELSCPHLLRASTSVAHDRCKDVDGRDELGHDGGGSPHERSDMRGYAG